MSCSHKFQVCSWWFWCKKSFVALMAKGSIRKFLGRFDKLKTVKRLFVFFSILQLKNGKKPFECTVLQH